MAERTNRDTEKQAGRAIERRAVVHWSDRAAVTAAEKRQRLLVSLGVSAFCLLFFLIYNIFSHGVHSPYMTFLFAWPLLFCVLPSLILLAGLIPEPLAVAQDLWNAGVAACTMSSLLRGIFEIAGTQSVLQVYLMQFGYLVIASGAAAYLIGWKKSGKPAPARKVRGA